MHYPPTDFKGGKKPKGGGEKSKFFLLRGVNEMGQRGVTSLLKPSSAFFYKREK